MDKTVQTCPKCGSTLIFRSWSKRYRIGYIWQEALADCSRGCGKWGLRYFNGKPTCDPYQVKSVAKKTKRGSWKLEPSREAQITAIYGSIQKYLDNGILVGMSLQSKT